MLATLARLEGPVYLSFDVDGLDPSIIPSTGTPQPDGLSWPQALEMVRATINAPCDLLGADVVEVRRLAASARLRPIAARLVMKILAYWMAAICEPSSVVMTGSLSVDVPNIKPEAQRWYWWAFARRSFACPFLR